MDYEELTNSSNLNVSDIVTPEESARYIQQEIIFLVFCITGMVSDFFIIYVTLRFKKMQTVPHVILTHWAIADLASLIVTPSSYRIISVIDNIPLPASFICFITDAGSILHITVILFAMVAAIEWFLASYFLTSCKTFHRHYKFVLKGIWGASLCTCIAFAISCSEVYVVWSSFLLFICLCGLALLVSVLQVTRLVRKCRRKSSEYPTLTLTVVTTFLFTWILGILNIFFVQFDYYHHNFAVIGCCLIFCSSLTNFTLLYRCSDNFKACFLQVLRCSRHRYTEEIDHSDLSDEHAA